jgi:hypothetical protein
VYLGAAMLGMSLLQMRAAAVDDAMIHANRGLQAERHLLPGVCPAERAASDNKKTADNRMVDVLNDPKPTSGLSTNGAPSIVAPSAHENDG